MQDTFIKGCLICLGAFSVIINVVVIKLSHSSHKRYDDDSKNMRSRQHLCLLIVNSCLGLISVFEGAAYRIRLSLWLCSLKAISLQFFGLSSFCWCARIIYSIDKHIRDLLKWTTNSTTSNFLLDHSIGWGIPTITVLIMLLANNMDESKESLCIRSQPELNSQCVYWTAIIFLIPHALILVYLGKLSYFYFNILRFICPLESTFRRARTALCIVVGARLLFFVTRVIHVLMLERNNVVTDLFFFIAPIILSMGVTFAFSWIVINKHLTEGKTTSSTNMPTGDTTITPEELENSLLIEDRNQYDCRISECRNNLESVLS